MEGKSKRKALAISRSFSLKVIRQKPLYIRTKSEDISIKCNVFFFAVVKNEGKRYEIEFSCSGLFAFLL